MNLKGKPFETSRKTLTWFGIFAADDNPGLLEKLAYITFTLITFVIILTALAGSVVFYWKFASVDLKRCLYALAQITALSGASYVIILAFFVHHEVGCIFYGLYQICQTYANDEFNRLLTEANNRCAWIWEMYLIYYLCGFSVGSVIMCLTSYGVSLRLSGRFDPKYMYYTYKIVLPWNDEEPLGYIAEALFTILCGMSYLLVNGSLLIFFISMCLHHEVFSEEFRLILIKLNHSNEIPNHKEIICKLVQFHNATKGWFLDTASLLSSCILVQMTSSALFLATVIFQLDMQVQHTDFNFAVLFLALFIGLANLFVYCYFGKLATDSCGKMVNSLFESNWQALSVDMQKYFILLIGNTQRPLCYHGSNVIVLNLETFSSLLKKVVTYYAMFKTITSKQ